MANIINELTTISDHRYGEQVRGAVHDAIEKINRESTNSYNSAVGGANSAQSMASQAASTANKAASDVAGAKSKMDYILGLYNSIGEWSGKFTIQDTNGQILTDENGNEVNGEIIFIIKK